MPTTAIKLPVALENFVDSAVEFDIEKIIRRGHRSPVCRSRRSGSELMPRRIEAGQVFSNKRNNLASCLPK
jgi:hypothetical protein